MGTRIKLPLQGAGWLVKAAHEEETFFPEMYSEEQEMIMEMCNQFIDTEVLPRVQEIDKMEPGLMQSLMDKAGELGLLGISIPEELGGLGKPFVESMMVAEGLGGGNSFSVAMAAHTGIGTLPILYFGTQEQKEKYIPKLATGEWKGAYGLTEPNSGSDALSAKTTAKLSNDGNFYLLNGQKCWITNGGFADVFTVFAKIDGDKFTAFIIEKGFLGFTKGLEEHKMGIKGSSTVQLYFQDCMVPKENVLGEIGKGHVIAFNILNIGRLKLDAACLGGAKKCISTTLLYSKTREQFKQPISNFGAIKQKLAHIAICAWADESALYRTAKLIQDKEAQLLEDGKSFAEALLGAAEEYAIECAIQKVHGSEMLDLVVDEGVQIHGGNGYSDEYAISRAYRDSRINRIFEGTNEINRLLIVDMVLKRVMKGKLDLMKPAMDVITELTSIPNFEEQEEEEFSAVKKAIANFKKIILMVAGSAVQKFKEKLEFEQEIIMQIANMAIATYVAESTLMRSMQISKSNKDTANNLHKDILNVFIYTTADTIYLNAKEAIVSFTDGDMQRMLILGLKRFSKTTPFNVKESRRRIADHLLQVENLKFS